MKIGHVDSCTLKPFSFISFQRQSVGSLDDKFINNFDKKSYENKHKNTGFKHYSNDDIELRTLRSDSLTDLGCEIPIRFESVLRIGNDHRTQYDYVEPNDIYLIHDANQMNDMFNKVFMNDIANRHLRSLFNYYNYENVKAFAKKYKYSDVNKLRLSFNMSEVIKCLKLYLSSAVYMNPQDWVDGHNYIRELVFRWESWYERCQKYLCRESVV